MSAQRKNLIMRRRKKGLLLVIVLVFVIIGIVTYLLVKKPFAKKEEIIEDSKIIESAVTSTAGKVDNRSELQKEAKIRRNNINSPVIYGDSIVFSSTTGTSYSSLFVYSISSETTKEIKVKTKYGNINNIVMNDSFIAFIDANTRSGGRIVVIDRSTNEQRTVKEYAFAMPKLAISDRYLVFMQQAGSSTDRLYMYDLNTGEAVTLKVFEGSVVLNGGLFINDEELLYSSNYTENGMDMSRLNIINLKTGKSSNYDWNLSIYGPAKWKNYIVFTSSASGVKDNLYVSINGENPKILISEITNMALGDGFVAYTKNDRVYVYMLETGEIYQINTDISKGLLANVNMGQVCWYDVTSYSDVDVIKYAIID